MRAHERKRKNLRTKKKYIYKIIKRALVVHKNNNNTLIQR